jgi:hypothetical protein
MQDRSNHSQRGGPRLRPPGPPRPPAWANARSPASARSGRHDLCWFRLSWRSEMSKLNIVRATALSLALAVATPAFAVGLRNVGGAMHVGNGGFRGAQASIGSLGPSGADVSHCRQRWAYYDPATRKYMGDDGEWRPCSAGSAARVAAATWRHTRKAHRASVSASQQSRNTDDYLE